MSTQTKGLIAIIVASLLWATNAFTNKILLGVFDQFTLAFLRFAIASLIVLPILLKQKQLFHFKKELLIVSLLSTANIALFYQGLKTTTANAALTLYATSPLFVLLFAKLFAREQITKRKLIGVMIGFAGIVTVITLPKLGNTHQVTGDLVGNLWILAAVSSWALYTSSSKILTGKGGVSPFLLTGVSIIVTSVVFFFLTLLDRHTINLTPLINPRNTLLLFHLAINVTVITYFLYQWAIKQTTAGTAALSGYLQPIFGIGLNMLVLGENVTPLFFIGAVLVLVGVYTASGMRLPFKATWRLT